MRAKCDQLLWKGSGTEKRPKRISEQVGGTQYGAMCMLWNERKRRGNRIKIESKVKAEDDYTVPERKSKRDSAFNCVHVSQCLLLLVVLFLLMLMLQLCLHVASVSFFFLARFRAFKLVSLLTAFTIGILE